MEYVQLELAEEGINDLQNKILDLEQKKEHEKGIKSKVQGVKYVQPKEFGDPETYMKSHIFPFRITKNEFGRHKYEYCLVKQYIQGSHDAKKDYLTEKLILPIIKPARVFAELRHFEDESLMLYLEGLMLNPLNTAINVHEQERLHTIVKAFSPIIKCYKEVTKYKDRINGVLKEEGNNALKKLGENTDDEFKLKKLDKKYYDEKMLKYSGRLENYLSPELKDKINQKKDRLIELLTDETFYGIGSRDAYPWHNLQRFLIDAAGLCECSMGLHLGCTIGHPSVYNNLPEGDKSFQFLTRMFAQKYNETGKPDEHNPALSDEGKFAATTYAGAAFGNFRLASGLYFAYGDKYKQSIDENLNAVSRQLEFI